MSKNVTLNMHLGVLLATAGLASAPHLVAQRRSRVAAIMGTVLLLSACGKTDPPIYDEGDAPPCWVYKGLNEEEIKQMEAYCNANATCSDEDGEACSVQTEATAP